MWAAPRLTQRAGPVRLTGVSMETELCRAIAGAVSGAHGQERGWREPSAVCPGHVLDSDRARVPWVCMRVDTLPSAPCVRVRDPACNLHAKEVG